MSDRPFGVGEPGPKKRDYLVLDKPAMVHQITNMPEDLEESLEFTRPNHEPKNALELLRSMSVPLAAKLFIEQRMGQTKFQQHLKERIDIINKPETQEFLYGITRERYPSNFTLSHQTDATPDQYIGKGITVSTGKNIHMHGESKLYIFGKKNPNFQRYLQTIWRAAHEQEPPGFMNHLQLETNREEFTNYCRSSPNAMVAFTDNDKDLPYAPETAITPSIMAAVTRVNATVRDMNLQEMIMEHVTGILSDTEPSPLNVLTEIENTDLQNRAKIRYHGRDNLEMVSALYSGLPIKGLNEFSSRIELEPNEVSPIVYHDFSDKQYRFGDLAEMMIDLKRNEVVRFV